MELVFSEIETKRGNGEKISIEKMKKTKNQHVENWLNHFGKTRNDVLLCENCESPNGIQFHHILLRSHGGGDNVGNIICLCDSCHKRAHKLKEPYLSESVLFAKHGIFIASWIDEKNYGKITT